MTNFTWPEGPLTQELFIRAWCDSREIPVVDRRTDGCIWDGSRRYAIRCDGNCDYSKCNGWIMVGEFPTIEEFFVDEWSPANGTPEAAYRRKYGVEAHVNCKHL